MRLRKGVTMPIHAVRKRSLRHRDVISYVEKSRNANITRKPDLGFPTPPMTSIKTDTIVGSRDFLTPPPSNPSARRRDLRSQRFHPANHLPLGISLHRRDRSQKLESRDRQRQ